MSQSKRKKFLIMAPKLERKDGNLDGVIIREKTDNVARKYQVIERERASACKYSVQRFQWLVLVRVCRCRSCRTR